jgi:hypothetical protein
METQTWKSITAGIVTIVAGVFGLRRLPLLVMARVHARMPAVTARPSRPAITPRTPSVAPNMFHFMGTFHLPIAIILCLLGALAIAGGIYALKRKIWGLALAGSIAAIFGCMPLGIAGLALTALSKKEFD